MAKELVLDAQWWGDHREEVQARWDAMRKE
jgi:hypothetical protein